MPFDRARALSEADDCERKLQILYHALGIQFATMKLLDGALVVRCEDGNALPRFCERVLQEYAPPSGQALN